MSQRDHAFICNLNFESLRINQELKRNIKFYYKCFKDKKKENLKQQIITAYFITRFLNINNNIIND